MDKECERLEFKENIRIFKNGKKAFGPGIAMLLEMTEQYGSLLAASGEMELAYSKAWKILNDSERALGVKLLERTRGGKNGGGAFLTQEGRSILNNYRMFCFEAEKKTMELFYKYFKEE